MVFQLTTIEVHSMEQSLAFYTEVLGVPLLRQTQSSGGAALSFLGEEEMPQLELICKGKPVPKPPSETFSIGFEMPSAEAVAQKTGKKLEGPYPMGPHKRFFFAQDPDGYRVQLIEKTEE